MVIGLLTATAEIDMARTRELIALARPFSITFHRAFDVTPEPFRALDMLIELGVGRVLSGMRFRRPRVFMGGELRPPEYDRLGASAASIRSVIARA